MGRSSSHSDKAGDVTHQFSGCGLIELLEADPRQVFVLDLLRQATPKPEVVFANKSIRTDPRLLDNVANSLSGRQVQSPAAGWADFMTWARASPPDGQKGCGESGFSHGNQTWTKFEIRGQWRVISGSKLSDGAANTSAPDAPESAIARASPRKSVSLLEEPPIKDPLSIGPGQQYTSMDDYYQKTAPFPFPSLGTHDWTTEHPTGKLSRHLDIVRSIKWEDTPLGSMSSWSPEFRQVANLIMANPHPAALFWGEELTVMYNEAYARGVAGLKHPEMMGTGFRGPFAALWDSVSAIFAECRETGKSVAMSEQMLPLERYGFLEETFFSWTISPLYGGGDTLLGLYNAPFETTRQTINHRRTHTLLSLGEHLSLAKSVSDFWGLVLKGLDGNEFDIPFALLYSIAEDPDTDEDSSISSGSSYVLKSCILEGSLGVPEGHRAAPNRLDLKRSKEGFVPAFRDAIKTREPSRLGITDGTLPEQLIKGINWRGYGEPSREAIVCPIRPTNGENVLGFLVVGINPRRPYDEDYKSFIKLMNTQLATSLASTTLFEEEIRRGKTAADLSALERLKLSEELAMQTGRLQRVIEVSPIGMFNIDASGRLLEANDRWYEMTGHSRAEASETTWMYTMVEDSQKLLEHGWKLLTIERQMSWSAELQLKRPWYDPSTGAQWDHWIILDAQPEFALDGSIRSILGTVADISLQKRSAEDALTRARLSEQLLLRTEEAEANERVFKRFSDLAPGGLVIMDPKGRITYANPQWFRISGYSGQESLLNTPLSLGSVILEDDLQLYLSKWDEMITRRATMTFEVRLRSILKSDEESNGTKMQSWVLASTFPEYSDEGELLSVMSCVTDISQIKWAEGLQKLRLEEAEETRRQQNNFIDITSHEMRNPLSAVVQCADGISSSMQEYEVSKKIDDGPLLELLRSNIDAAETIMLCAQHQKLIVDDILTISKLDSDLLVITPYTVQPIKIVQRALKMFDAELQVNKIRMHFRVGGSIERLKVDKVMIDSSRLIQVLINLISNAIKFTKSEAERFIWVSMSAHLQPPTNESSGFDYVPTRKERSDLTATKEWGTGQILYLRFEVRDTGCGLSPDEKKLLFLRFSQASPRTHVRYGGSGLGLFISRQLTELQCGEIGVASEAGVGSTFAFYVKSRRAQNLDESPVIVQPSTFELDMTLRKNAAFSVAGKLPSASTLSEGGVSKAGASSNSSRTGKAAGSYHVLIVEDNLVNQKILAAQMRKAGCTVYVANHGGEALALLRETRYWRGKETDGKELSVILMDLEMPVMDGLTCVQKIRELQGEGTLVVHVPVIAVTANARMEQIEKAKEAGMDDVMPKPFRIGQLLEKISALLESDEGQ